MKITLVLIMLSAYIWSGHSTTTITTAPGGETIIVDPYADD